MASCDSCSSKNGCASAASGGCSSGEKASQPTFAELHELAKVRSVIGIASGKGGVGKSMVTSMLAVNLARKGWRVGILDADVTGPSIPKAFGLVERLQGSEAGIYPAKTALGTQVVSINLLLENPEAPVLWRGPIIAGMVKQFWTDVIWDQIDIMLIDMPPGTGDVPLTVFQAIPLDGVIVVSTPQDLVSMIVRKARNMALMMHVHILGFVENMSYVQCPDCDKKLAIFGPGKTAEAAAEMNVPVLDQLPIDPYIAEYVDAGQIELLNNSYLTGSIAAIESVLARKS
jgi:Mrp family chromosome partitioning ATPase